MTKTDFIDYICRPYCMFFKEGEKEEMACLGARVAEALVEKSCFDTLALGVYEKDAVAWLNPKHDEILFQQVCHGCEFLSEDCEYRSEGPPEDTEPCGGLILLALLMANEIIDHTVLKGAHEPD